VWVVSCKSWQAGFNVQTKLDEIRENKKRSGRESLRFFRELVQPKWSEAFREAIQEATGSESFTYITAVTRIRGDRSLWEQHPPFQKALGGNPIRLLSLEEMMQDSFAQMTKTVVPSQLGRTLQLLRASGAAVEWSTKKKLAE
jgi:urease accessory protein UreF